MSGWAGVPLRVSVQFDHGDADEVPFECIAVHARQTKQKPQSCSCDRGGRSKDIAVRTRWYQNAKERFVEKT